jgi:hypothetical protein
MRVPLIGFVGGTLVAFKAKAKKKALPKESARFLSQCNKA